MHSSSLRDVMNLSPRLNICKPITLPKLHLTLPTRFKTPRKELEKKLNVEYGPGNEFYEDCCKYARLELKEGWIAQTEIDGPNYRRGKIALPSPEKHFFSITTMYMNSVEEYSRQSHSHPYGELNCVMWFGRYWC